MIPPDATWFIGLDPHIAMAVDGDGRLRPTAGAFRIPGGRR